MSVQIIDPQREKKVPSKCTPNEDWNKPAHPGQSLRCPYEETLYPSTIQNALSEDSDQTVGMHMLIWIFAGRTCPTVYVHFLDIAAYLE